MKTRIKKHIGVHHFTSWKVFIFILAVISGGVLGITYSIHAYPEVFKTDIIVGKNYDIGPSEPIVVEFSQPVITATYDRFTKSDPAANFNINWEEGNKKMVCSPKTFWRPGTEYKLNLPEGENIAFTKVGPATVNFSTQELPKVIKISPQDGAKDVTLDIEDPIVVDFDKPVSGFYIKAVLSPNQGVTYQNNPEKTQFKFLPRDKVDDGTTYDLKIYAKYDKDSDEGFKEIFHSNFTTIPPAVITWDKDHNARIEQAKKFTKAKITSGKYIDINLSAQILSTFEDGKLLTSNMISSGKASMPTPKGQFSIHNKASRVWSKKYGLYMPWWMAVASDGSFGIHELPEWPGGYKEGAAHLGIPVSHGCIRLGVGPAKQIYEWADIGTPVVIY